MVNILIACEESQTICRAFRELGDTAFSADIQEPSGGYPEWHILGDVLPLINGNCEFVTMDGTRHKINGKWDLLIAHPPCTYLSILNNRHLSPKCNTADKINARLREREKAVSFFMEFINADCEKICVENPIGYMNNHYRKPDQIVHPYYFAECELDIANYVKKATCLWLKNLPPLQRTSNLPPPTPLFYLSTTGKAIHWTEGIKGEKRQRLRAKTFSGVARAIAEQWGELL